MQKSNTIQAKPRLKWVDCAKGVAMLSVILGHCLEYINSDMGCKTLLLPIVYSFSIPLFFMISGFFHKSEGVGFGKYLLKKTKSILVPYATFTVICLAVSAIRIYIFKTPLDCTVFQEFKLIVVQRHYNMLWFMAVLFLTEIAAYFLLRKRNYILISVVIAISVLSAFLLRRYGFLYLPWSIDIVPFAMVFYAVGFAVRNLEEKVLCKWLFPAYLVIGLALTIINLKITSGLRYVNMYKADYGSLPLYFLAGIAMSLAILCLCKWIGKSKLFGYIGKNSLIFYGFHPTVLTFLMHFIRKIPLNSYLIYIAVVFVALVIITAIVSILPPIINNTPLCILFGKPYKKKANK